MQSIPHHTLNSSAFRQTDPTEDDAMPDGVYDVDDDDDEEDGEEEDGHDDDAGGASGSLAGAFWGFLLGFGRGLGGGSLMLRLDVNPLKPGKWGDELELELELVFSWGNGTRPFCFLILLGLGKVNPPDKGVSLSLLSVEEDDGVRLTVLLQEKE